MVKATAAPSAIDEDRQLDSWSDKNSKFDVSQSAVDGGLMYHLAVHARVDATPDQIFSVLTDPDSAAIFRSIKECTHRNTLEQRGAVHKLEVCHRATTRFMYITINFDTSLHVWEDAHNKTIRFEMARTGYMRKFDGMWSIRPFTQTSLNDLACVRNGEPVPLHPHRRWLDAGALFHSLMHHHGGGPAPSAHSLVSLEQKLMPRMVAPPGVRHIVRAICLKQVKEMVEDLRLEVARRYPQGSALTSGASSTAVGQHRRGRGGQTVAAGGAAAAPAACLSAASLLWEHATPFNITIRL